MCSCRYFIAVFERHKAIDSAEQPKQVRACPPSKPSRRARSRPREVSAMWRRARTRPGACHAGRDAGTSSSRMAVLCRSTCTSSKCDHTDVVLDGKNWGSSSRWSRVVTPHPFKAWHETVTQRGHYATHKHVAWISRCPDVQKTLLARTRNFFLHATRENTQNHDAEDYALSRVGCAPPRQ